MKEFIREFRERWRARTPRFLRKIKKTAVSIGVICVAILGVTQYPGVVVHPVFVSVISYILVTCAAIAGTAQMAKQDPEEAAREATEKIEQHKQPEGHDYGSDY